jgi:hypothetical protein
MLPLHIHIYISLKVGIGRTLFSHWLLETNKYEDTVFELNITLLSNKSIYL